MLGFVIHQGLERQVLFLLLCVHLREQVHSVAVLLFQETDFREDCKTEKFGKQDREDSEED